MILQTKKRFDLKVFYAENVIDLLGRWLDSAGGFEASA